jgi:uncharacterized membrane protein YeaQ/YmgE (transglycosylase-associated protein family)
MTITIPTFHVLSVSLYGGDLLTWLIVGLIVGFLASVVVRGRGYGCIGDTIIGIVGGLIGGFLASFFGFTSLHLLGSLIVAFIGACILVAILRAIAPGR